MRTLLPSIALLPLLFSACGDDKVTVRVQGRTLVAEEILYGHVDNGGYCPGLDPLGQYEILFTDFTGVCDAITGGKLPDTNLEVFHGGKEETNLRIVIPGDPSAIKVSQENRFKVARTTCADGNPRGAQATAIFAYNPPEATKYGITARADSGEVVITQLDKTAQRLKGRFTLVFGGEQVSGSFDAPYCPALKPGYGD